MQNANYAAFAKAIDTAGHDFIGFFATREDAEEAFRSTLTGRDDRLIVELAPYAAGDIKEVCEAASE